MGSSINLGEAETETLQPQAQFEAAIRNTTSSPSLILLTVVDDRTGQSWTGCTTAGLLVGAIHMERDEQRRAASVQEAVQVALSNASHVFHFSKQSALYNLTPVKDGRFSKACGVLKKTGCMRKPDLSGEFEPC
jgi:hypothetical protein